MTCPTGKVPYPTDRLARAWRGRVSRDRHRRMPMDDGARLRVYTCVHCGQRHLTSAEKLPKGLA